MECVGQMLAAGLDVRRAVAAVVGEGAMGKELAARMLARVESGASLTPAFQDFLAPEQLFILRASEQAGTFADGLLSVARRIDEQLEWRRTISKSVAYPGVLLLSCYALALFVRLEVDPMLRRLVASLTVSHDTTHPLTAIAANLPIALTTLMTGAVFGLPCLWWVQRRTSFANRLPLPLTQLMVRIRSERLAYQLSVQLGAGIPLLDLLRAESEQVASLHADEAMRLHQALLRGRSLAAALQEDCRPIHYDPLLLELVQVAEETGDMASCMSRACELLRRQIVNQLDTMGRYLEPFVTGIMGLIVGSVVYSVFGPMYTAIAQLS
ncbi:type II secretory pathway component PulF [Alicyclobacillus sacchari]|uniref:Type II secretory pathway component PulF n=1 Tax=Alicyclobacillus sacchari TaxID=392010 RepID=A0A4R8LIV3_9BACL|nr:type II secretion system F family protein [Alicyclobacillus sacchari]TDY43373.1 type II secretory pathway component PulF [Alicyclobacillus sacchari]